MPSQPVQGQSAAAAPRYDSAETAFFAGLGHSLATAVASADKVVVGLQNKAADAAVALGVYGDRQPNLLGGVEKVLGGIAYVAVAPTDWKAANGEFASAQEAVQGGLVRVGAYGERQGGLVGGAIHVGAGLLYAADEVLQPGSVKDAIQQH
jgi:hypothetical protein